MEFGVVNVVENVGRVQKRCLKALSERSRVIASVQREHRTCKHIYAEHSAVSMPSQYQSICCSVVAFCDVLEQALRYMSAAFASFR